MANLPNLFVTRFDGLTRPAPLVVQAIDSPERVTLRTWREVENGEPAQLDIDIGRHADVMPERTFGDAVIDGGLLADRLAGIAFQELGAVSLDIEKARGLHEWSDMARWMFQLDATGAPMLPFNVRAATVNTKVTGSRHLMVGQNDCALVVFVYFASLDFSDASFLVVGHPVHGAVGPLSDKARLIAPDQQAAHSQRSEPRILLSGPGSVPAGGMVTIECRMTSSGGRGLSGFNTELFLESTGGALPLRRIPVTAGRAAFRVAAPWNQPGDSFKVKAGFRHVTGAAEHGLTVV
jgi:hypothetical protein